MGELKAKTEMKHSVFLIRVRRLLTRKYAAEDSLH